MKKSHVVIVGGTKGLGRSVTNLFVEDGYKLSILGRTNRDNYDDTQDIAYVKADLANDEQFINTFAEVIKQRGQISHLIFLQRFKGNGDTWDSEIEVSLNITRKIIDRFKSDFAVSDKTVSSITLASSIMGRLVNDSQPLSYSIAKAGLNYLVKYYAAQLGPVGIRVNGVSPITFIKEESKKFYLEEKPEINELYKQIVPLRRMCTTEDVAGVIHFLCSDRASFISGQNIDVDGGLSNVSHETLARTLKNL